MDSMAGAEPAHARSYQPMNVNFGLFPPLAHALKGQGGERLRGSEKVLAKKRAITGRALADLERWIGGDDRDVAAE
jgi:methylenetetrahydrofolate--tRNA-(uracil-5-)-methyltransferase